MVESIAERITNIKSNLPKSVRLIAVTKQVSVDTIRTAYAAGIRDFGENRVQETEAKQAQLQDLPDITWHLIGHLQSNKVVKALKQFQWIHSVDNLKLAKRLNALAEQFCCSPNICLQVKILPDPNKYGWTIKELMTDLAELNQCQHLKIKGLMTIPPQGLDDLQTLSVFQKTKELALEISEKNFSHLKTQELSMGMSEDYNLAISAGTTIVRLGRILFGERKNKKD
ncbi:MAG: YggS family pyridoxal phosphate-dependent enzyme [Trichodesmium sp. St16_bin4-tuft]|nr:YggS family pyridoxal phosphate-dependent enzyme [Trichodesmium sp. MAG_R01]MDE5074284.1 YggS family pyridoxal phosphate-dependent enzyme [Trichodesmium sp. St5_bin8]MDE5077485.1 YggS family pyridoxal phosphate-dependent enzyme [Trichodesmium sp. St2_bin6]MDE5090937.1 YggS family pyridoxal phosphate-dependent enzyme [Trichodesmium sp. St18_bin3_1_1]MDE5100839.1 YggS family pyridoxal phosphate-dependent enzyme [Trichodesmium sp. St16_bin4-tuft]MDE5104340.1 YggS family pyridoxal phosphate-dep